MTPGIALLVIGGILLVSGWRNQSLMDVFDGTPGSGTDSTGHLTDPSPTPQPFGASTPTDLTNLPTGVRAYDGHPVAAWIVPILKWAKNNGWHGVVTSGYRTAQQQEQAATNYGLQHYPDGPQTSNHRGWVYPKGAVDVTQAEQLNSVLQHYPHKPTLVWGGPVMGDTVHFSANGH